MIKVEVTKDKISLLGHANFADYGKDIVCAAASSVVITSVEAIAMFDKTSIDVKETTNRLDIIINKHNDMCDKLINNMLNLLHELVKKYPQNIKIINKEE